MKLWSKGIFKIFALVAMLCVVGSVFAASTSLSEVSKKPVIIGKVDKRVKILKDKIEIVDKLENGGKIILTTQKDFSKMDVVISDGLSLTRYKIYVLKSGNKYKVLLYEDNKLKQSLIMDKNPIKIITSNYIYSNIKYKSSWWLPSPETNIDLSLSGNPTGNVGDTDFLTVSVNSECQEPYFVVNAYYVKLPEGVEYIGGGGNPSDSVPAHGFGILHLDEGEYHDFAFHLGRVYGPCTVLVWYDARFLDSDYSDSKRVTIEYTSPGTKTIYGKSSITVIGLTYPWDVDSDSVCKVVR